MMKKSLFLKSVLAAAVIALATSAQIGSAATATATFTVTATVAVNCTTNAIRYTRTQPARPSGANIVGTDTVAGTGNGTDQPLTVYGRVPAGQQAPSGSYTDSVTGTITY
jgi:spore coat protein U-like protein